MKNMNTQMKTSVRMNTKTLAGGLLLAGLLTTASVLTGWSATPAEDRARGEEMLRRAHQDVVEASRLSEASAKAAQIAQQDQETANQKRLQAHNLERAAFLLIRDSKRLAAAELRARAENDEVQVKTEAGELLRLQGLLAHAQQTAADTTSAAAKIRDAANNESNPAEKAELGKMAEALSAQAAESAGEAAGIEKRIQPVQAEINRLNAAIRQLNESALRLAPVEP